MNVTRFLSSYIEEGKLFSFLTVTKKGPGLKSADDTRGDPEQEPL